MPARTRQRHDIRETPIQQRIGERTGLSGTANSQRRRAATANARAASSNFTPRARVIRGNPTNFVRTNRTATISRYNSNIRSGSGSVGGRSGAGTTVRRTLRLMQPGGGSIGNSPLG